MERFRPKPEGKESMSAGYFTVYCVNEGRTLYSSAGKNKQIERFVAERTAFGHANDLGHRVYVFEAGKLKSRY